MKAAHNNTNSLSHEYSNTTSLSRNQTEAGLTEWFSLPVFERLNDYETVTQSTTESQSQQLTTQSLNKRNTQTQGGKQNKNNNSTITQSQQNKMR